MVLQFPLHHHHHHHHDQHQHQDYGMPRHGFLAGSPQWRNVMHMSILNALPASMTLAPLNDVNNGRQAASMVAWMAVRRQEVGGKKRQPCWHPTSGAAVTCIGTTLPLTFRFPLFIPSSYLPHYATLNALNISDDATRYGCWCECTAASSWQRCRVISDPVPLLVSF